MQPKKRGRGSGSKGRTPGSGDEKTEEEKQIDARTRQAKSRGQDSTPVKLVDRNARRNAISSSLSSPSASRASRSRGRTAGSSRPGSSLSTASPSTKSRGRPPASGSQAETPNTRRRKNTQSHQRSRREKKTKKARSAASQQRWQGNKESSSDSSSESSDSEIEPRRLDFDENLNPHEMEVDGNPNEEVLRSSRTAEEPHGQLGRSTWYEYLKKVKAVLAKNSRLQNYDVCLDLVRRPKFKRNLKVEKMEIKVNPEKYKENYMGFANITGKTISRRAQKVLDCLKSCKEPEIVVEDAILETIREDSFAISVLEACGLEIPDHLLSLTHWVSRTYSRVKDEVVGSRRGADRYLSTRAALETAQRCQLSLDTHGHTGILKDVIGSSWQFANSILTAIKNNTTETLFERGRRKDCIKMTPFPELLSAWAKRPDNSRSVPGNETVSIGYGQQATKFILLKPRRVVLEEFLEAHPDCHFTQRTLSREWPQNVRAASSRDLDRNVCGLHSNMRRMERALKKHLGSVTVIPSSCRLMASLAMCRKADIDPLEPTSWVEDCVKGRCRDCPVHQTHVPDQIRNQGTTVALWGTKMCPIKNKVINNLHDWNLTIGELAEKFDNSLPKLKLHIYTAAHQWSSAKLSSESITPNTIVTIEDYQAMPV